MIWDILLRGCLLHLFCSQLLVVTVGEKKQVLRSAFVRAIFVFLSSMYPANLKGGESKAMLVPLYFYDIRK